MTDWLEVARRALAAALDRKEVSAVGEVGALKKSESFRLHRSAAYDVETPFGVSDDVLPLEDDNETKAHIASPAKIAKTPVSSILAVCDKGSVNKSLLTIIRKMRTRRPLRLRRRGPQKMRKARARNCQN
jgi:hypothetical protein